MRNFIEDKADFSVCASPLDLHLKTGAANTGPVSPRYGS
jgi:hypothetical protein